MPLEQRWGEVPDVVAEPGADRPAVHAAAPDPRSVTLDEFGDCLRTVNNRDGRPYEEATINAYVSQPRHSTRG